MNCTIAWSSSSPPVRIDVSDTIPDRAITAISVVPPPMSITMLPVGDRKSTRLNSSHGYISYAVFCLKKKKRTMTGGDEQCFLTIMRNIYGYLGALHKIFEVTMYEKCLCESITNDDELCAWR